MVFMSKKNKGLPITVENIKEINLNESFNKLFANVLFTKTNLVKKNIIEKLNLKESQFETLIRKEASKISTMIFKGNHPNTLMAERYYYEKKYLFTIEVYFENNTDNLMLVNYFTFVEEITPELSQLTIENKLKNESSNSDN